MFVIDKTTKNLNITDINLRIEELADLLNNVKSFNSPSPTL